MRRDTGPVNDNPGSAAAVGCTLSLLPGFLKPEWLRDVLLEKPRLSVRVTKVDFIQIQAVQFRDMPDGFLPNRFDSLDRVLALDWERMIPGHPYAGGRLGTKYGPPAAGVLALSDQFAAPCFKCSVKNASISVHEPRDARSR